MITRPVRRLRTRILTWTFIPAVIILSAVALTIWYAYQRVTEDLVVGRNQQLTHLSAAQLAAHFHPYVDTLSELSHSQDLSSGVPYRQQQALAAAEGDLMAFDGGVLLLDPLGKVAATTPGDEDLLGADWSGQDFFRELLRGGRVSYSNIISSGYARPNVVVIAVPVLDDRGEYRGTLAGLFRIEPENTSAFYGGVVKLRLTGAGSAYLVDGTGRVIYHPDEQIIGQDYHARPDVARLLKGQVGTLRMRDASRVELLATYAPVPGTPWGLVAEESWAGLLAASGTYGRFLFLLLALGILTPVVLVLLGVKRITDPVAVLTSAAREISGGRYGERVSIRTGDELEELGDQFNRMSAQLQLSYSQLEERVQARTKELATLNATAAVASHSLNLLDVLGKALDKTLEVMGMETGAAYSVQGDMLIMLVQRNRSPEFVVQASPRPVRGSVVEQAALAGKPLVWSAPTFPERRLKGYLEQEGIRQVVCVPLLAKQKLVGAFVMGTHTAHNIAPEEISLLAAIGQQIGVAVENAQLYQQAEETAAAAERTRLARELHDAVTQTLFSASLIAEVLPEVWQADEAEGRRRMEELRQLTRGALAEMRTLLVELRPNALTQIPLQELVRQFCESLVGRARLPVEVCIEGQRKLPADVQVAFYRITQEALNNVVKHSKAAHAAVTLRLLDNVTLAVADDGCGFEPANVTAEHLGLRIMRERAEAIGAQIDFSTQPGEGTRVRVIWSGTQARGETA